MKKLIFTTVVLFLGAFLFFSVNSCKKSDSPTVVQMTLYDTLGGSVMVNDPAHSGTQIESGRLAIRSVIDSAIFVIAADASINAHFKVLLAEVTSGNLSGFMALSKNLTDFFCVATGSKNFTYGGKNMRDAHDPAANSRMNGKSTNSDFDAFVADVVTAAKKNKVPDAIIARFGAIINTLRGVVVQA